MDKDKIINIIKSEYQDPKCELEFSSPFELLVAVVLSAQCTDKRVNQVTKILFENFNTAEKIAEMDLVVLENIIRPCGFYHNKAKAIKSLSCDIVSRFNGEFPKTKIELKSLRGVGEKTANVVVSLIYNEPAIAVDTHVFRVSNRIGLTNNSKNPIETEKTLTKHFPEELIATAHHWLILHGRYVCTARKPNCPECGIRPYCKFYSLHTK